MKEKEKKKVEPTSRYLRSVRIDRGRVYYFFSKKKIKNIFRLIFLNGHLVNVTHKQGPENSIYQKPPRIR